MSLQDKIKNLIPLYDRILIKKINESEQTTSGGIFIPEQAKEKAQTGTIIATGKGKVLQNGSIQQMTVKVGDQVFFGKFSGVEVGEDYVILKEDEVLGIL